ncbi:hypothetical protein KY348_00255 [Candidatus Woesearchaeota archaeon]|nr:hypothetical protein [Candidatus Woesearchaeota archaeon]
MFSQKNPKQNKSGKKKPMQKKSRQNKGIYSLATSFLFIIILIFVVIAVVFFFNLLKAKRMQASDELVKYVHIRDAKNKILSSECYTHIIEEADAEQECFLPEGFIKGYVIEMLVYPNCTTQHKTWEHMLVEDEAGAGEEGEIYPYFVPVQANTTGNICPGKLKVIY